MPISLEVASNALGVSEAISDNIQRRREVIAQQLQLLGRTMNTIMAKHTPKATMALADSTTSVVHILPDSVELVISQPARNIRGVIYQDFVVDGRRPGRMPPIAAIVPWVEAVFPTITSVEDTAWGVATNIARRGTSFNNYPLRALGESLPFIEVAAQRLGVKLAVDLVDIDRKRSVVSEVAGTTVAG